MLRSAETSGEVTWAGPLALLAGWAKMGFAKKRRQARINNEVRMGGSIRLGRGGQLQINFGVAFAEFALGFGVEVEIVAFGRKAIGTDEGAIGNFSGDGKVSVVDHVGPLSPRAFLELAELADDERDVGSIEIFAEARDERGEFGLVEWGEGFGPIAF